MPNYPDYLHRDPQNEAKLRADVLALVADSLGALRKDLERGNNPSEDLYDFSIDIQQIYNMSISDISEIISQWQFNQDPTERQAFAMAIDQVLS